MLARSSLFLAGVVWLYVCGLHRFTTGLHYAYIGGWEIVHGRLPYRDFEFLTGPALIFIQALFFKLLGTSYAVGYVSHAALLNGLAAALIYDIMERRLEDRRAAALGASLTVFWYYAVFMAVPWYDHEAHFFILAALWALERRKDPAGRFVAGLLAATSFFCKQSHGAFGLIYLCLYLWTAEGFPAAAQFTAGGTAGVAGWALGCASIAGWAPFYHDFFYLPLHSGRVGFTHSAAFKALFAGLLGGALAWRPLRPYRLFAAPIAFSLAALAVQSPLYLVFLLPLFLWRDLAAVEERALILALVLIQLDGRLTSNNEIKVYWPFLGIFFAYASALLPRRLASICWAFLLLWGARVSYFHKIRSLFPGTTFLFALLALALAVWALRERKKPLAAVVLLAASGALLLRGARTYRAHLADPGAVADYELTRPSRSIDEPALRHVTMTESDARGVTAALAAIRALPPERKPVFLYCECDILYPLIGQPLPPFWWFDPTSTYKPGDGTEDRIIDFLRKDGYGTWVWCPPNTALMEMPKLERWLKDNTKFEHDYDGYRFYEIEKARPQRRG
jgi:hypothetical protein